MKKFILCLINFYRNAISPHTRSSCRFLPTCSAYFCEAVEKHGSLKGCFLGIKRILKCHPFYKGDIYDPVP